MHLKLPPFQPPALLSNTHTQCFLNSNGPRKYKVLHQTIAFRAAATELILDGANGAKLLAQYNRPPAASVNGSPRLAVLLHGWEGSSESIYLLSAAHYLTRHGFSVLRINFRDHGESHHLNPELFNSTQTPDVAEAIRHFLSDHSYENCYLAGYSLGGSFALRIAADDGDDIPLSAAVAICPPVDPGHSMQALMDGQLIYQLYFTNKWRSSLYKKLSYFPELGYREVLSECKTLADINNYFVPNYTDYPDPDSYFSAYALTGDRLANLGVPSYLITSKDDPIVPVADSVKIHRPDALHIETTEYGGHCGFLENYRMDSWAERQFAAIFNHH